MNILDIKESDSNLDDYFVWETVWNKDILINIVVENENDLDKPELEGFNVGKIIRPLRKKLDFVENNRSIIEDVIMREEIEEFTADDLKTLYIDELLLMYFADTGGCELGLYLMSETDCLDGGTLILSVKNDNTVTFDDFMGE